jgi:alpha-tubulin suppressor-like RCC1 family protein
MNPMPKVVTGLSSGVLAVAGGAFFTCAQTAPGAAQCWGQNVLGQLGDGTMTQRGAPAPVLLPAGKISSIAAGGDYENGMRGSAYAIVDGVPYAWGDNFWGQIGDGTTATRAVPVRVAGF